MDERSLDELLNVYNLPLTDNGKALSESAGLTPEAREEIESLSHLSVLLKQSLMPQSARAAFREDLHQGLMHAAMQRQGWRGLLVLQLREHWKLTAATASGVSVAVGALTVVAWYRGRSHP